MAAFDNLIEYADPLIYDLENPDSEPVRSFYQDLAQQTGGPVLEIGCGTGRVTIPLAQAGIEITGLDVVPAMLQRAKQKAGPLHIQWVEADARSFRLNRRFAFIFEAGSVFAHLLERTDQEKFLASVREHLEPEGIFALSVLFPHREYLEDVKVESDWFSYEMEPGVEVKVSGTEKYDELRQVKLETAYRRWTDRSGAPVTRIAPLALRCFFPQELETLLHYNGFKIIERFGDFDRSPLTEKSPMQIYLCQNSRL